MHKEDWKEVLFCFELFKRVWLLCTVATVAMASDSEIDRLTSLIKRNETVSAPHVYLTIQVDQTCVKGRPSVSFNNPSYTVEIRQDVSHIAYN